jgi:hypothetical protein
MNEVVRHDTPGMNRLDVGKLFRRIALSAAALVCGLLACAVLRAHDAAMHGDHNPHHGGFVLMYGEDLHYEVVLFASGKMQIWLSGPTREDLPASVASDVAAEIETTAGKHLPINMAINDSGECWEGQGPPIKDEQAVLHLAFTYAGQPAVMTFPASVLMDAVRESEAKSNTRAAAANGHQGGAH